MYSINWGPQEHEAQRLRPGPHQLPVVVPAELPRQLPPARRAAVPLQRERRPQDAVARPAPEAAAVKVVAEGVRLPQPASLESMAELPFH
jgi:hypothetical protein